MSAYAFLTLTIIMIDAVESIERTVGVFVIVVDIIVVVVDSASSSAMAIISEFDLSCP